jgi:hypothetical protein
MSPLNVAICTTAYLERQKCYDPGKKMWTGYPLVPLLLFFGQIENISFSSYFASFYA